MSEPLTDVDRELLEIRLASMADSPFPSEKFVASEFIKLRADNARLRKALQWVQKQADEHRLEAIEKSADYQSATVWNDVRLAAGKALQEPDDG